ncbi:HNH endonuclease [Flavobacterium sp. CBA20B-1]|uniref:HNH endonuclease n=1 Tax=unclassified Flavobacterium TaxID=196869 RepID=UPI002223FF35|nr:MULTISPECIES: HNH endonuclease [unclassified Flavobacterium]WCM41367.1 HNH endonuclease [Flavobacterium sp. CBA20B-1]
MTKVEAIKKVLEDNGGVAIWSIIYNQIEKYYPEIKRQKDWKAGIRGVLYRDLGKSFKMLEEGVVALIKYDENNLVLIEDIGDTSKSIQAKIRIGQEKFRKNLIKHLKECPITGIDEKRILLASHIKPWSVSTNEERLDIYNGFIFSPTIDKLFDKGLITFENNKELIISPTLSEVNIGSIGIIPGKKYFKLPIENRINYLEFHRENIFVSLKE